MRIVEEQPVHAQAVALQHPDQRSALQIARTLPEDAEAGGGLMVAVIQLSIALGSTAGGMVFDHIGWQSTFAMSAILLLSAVVLTGFTARKSATGK